MSWSVNAILLILVICAFVLAPVALVWGWIRWSRLPKLKTISSMLSLVAFILSTCSALLAIGAAIYAQQIHGFGFYDPLHLRIIRWGALLSAVGVLFGLVGSWRKSPLRWFAIASALGTLSYWTVVAEGE